MADDADMQTAAAGRSDTAHAIHDAHDYHRATAPGASPVRSAGPLADTTLAPLSYLQNQRRGSITDPSLHASSGSSHAIGPTFTQAPSRSDTLSALTRPLDPPPHSARAMASPSGQIDAEGAGAAYMDAGDDKPLGPPRHFRQNALSQGHASQQSYSSSSAYGTKRKMSIDRVAFPSGGGDDADLQLVGPASGVNPDAEAPASKRRGSIVAAHNISQLSLHDRRHSLDSRARSPNSQWWMNERRDPNSPAGFPGAYPPPGFAADSPHGRPPGGMASFAWHGATQTPGHPGVPAEGDPHLSGPPHPYDPSSPPLSMVPSPLGYAAERRMSAPGGMSSLASPTSARAMRARSRPASRASESVSGMPQAESSQYGEAQSPALAGEGDESGSSSGLQAAKSGTTPYSRSPELRVSHKLAERKRRREMKDLFDELRDHLPADRGMKASKWEILSKAIDFITQIKQSHQDMSREIEMLRHEVDSLRQGVPSFGPGGAHGAYPAPAPHMISNAYPPVATGPPPHQGHPQHPTHTPHQSMSRPASSQPGYPTEGGSSGQQSAPPNGSGGGPAAGDKPPG